MSTTDARPTSPETHPGVNADDAMPDAAHPAGQRRPRPSLLRDNAVSLTALVVAVLLTVLVMKTTPQSRDLSSAWVLIFKLTPFVAAAVSIAWLSRYWIERLRLAVILPPLVFIGFFCYFVPRQFFTAEDFNKLYVVTLMMVPYVILCLCLCLRLGGASTSLTIRMAVALLLIQLSGLEDLAFLLVNPLDGTPLRPIPEVWKWADHITVFLGHPPTKVQAYAFITVHLLLAIAVLAAPAFLARRRRSARRSEQAPAA